MNSAEYHYFAVCKEILHVSVSLKLPRNDIRCNLTETEFKNFGGACPMARFPHFAKKEPP